MALAGSAVLEARERVRAALRNSGFEVPSRRITINLAPARCDAWCMMARNSTRLRVVIRAIVYARLSRDRDGTQTATARQVADCRKYAEAKGWSIVGVHEDADLSAYSSKVRRLASKP